MKKLINYSVILSMAMFGMFMTGCTSEMDDNYNSSSKEQEVRQELMECAEDYGVDMKLDANTQYSSLPSSKLDTLKSMIKGFSMLKGTYTLTGQKSKNGLVAKLNSKKPRRTAADNPIYSESFRNDTFVPNRFCETFECYVTISWQYSKTSHTVTSFDSSGYIVSSRRDGYSTANITYEPRGYITGGLSFFTYGVKDSYGHYLEMFDISVHGKINGETCTLSFS